MSAKVRFMPTDRLVRVHRRHGAAGLTLLEVLVSLAVLGIIIVPLCAAFITSLQRTQEVETAIGASADAQRIASWWTVDVQNVEPTGYTAGDGLLDPDAPAPCPSLSSFTNTSDRILATFSWDTNPSVLDDLPDDDPNNVTLANAGPKKATWAVRGQGGDAELIRRYCVKDQAVREDLVASTFFKRIEGVPASYLVHGPDIDDPSQRGDYGNLDFCHQDGKACTIQVSGNFNYSLTVDRRVPGEPPRPASTLPCPQVTGAVASNRSLLVGWLPVSVPEGVSPITGYKVFLTTSKFGSVVDPPGVVTIPSATTLSHEFTGLVNGQKYWVQTQSVNAHGEGTNTDCVAGSFEPTPVAPGVPRDVTAERPVYTDATGFDPAGERVRVHWEVPRDIEDAIDDGGSAITGWILRVRVAETGELLNEIEVSDPNARSAVVPGLTNGALVSATVAAENAIGAGTESLPSNEVVPCGVPSKPDAPQLNTHTDQRIRVVFQEPDSHGCQVERFQVFPDPAWTGANPSPWLGADYDPDIPPEDPRHDDWLEFITPPLNASVSYRASVTAWNAVGPSEASDLSAGTETAPTPTRAPANLEWEPTYYPENNEGDREGGILSWLPVPDIPAFNAGYAIRGYRVTRYHPNGTLDRTWAVDGANSDDFSMSGFQQVVGSWPNESYQTYKLEMQTENDNGASVGEFGVAEINVIPGGRPLVSPTQIAPTGHWAGSNLSGSAINIRWTALTAEQRGDPQVNGGRLITDNQVQWRKVNPADESSTAGAYGWQRFDTGNGNNNSQPVPASPGQKYLLRVAAVNASGASIPAQVVEAYAPTLIGDPTAASVALDRPIGLTSGQLRLDFPDFPPEGNPEPVTWSGANPGNPPVDYRAVCTASGEANRVFEDVIPGTNILTGLANGKAWSCTVTGTATYGNGSTDSGSRLSNSFTPYTVPDPVTDLIVESEGPGAKISWTAPVNDGGNAITGYTVSSNVAVAGLPATVTSGTTFTTGPIAVGQSVVFSVTANNQGGSSAPVSAAPYTQTVSVPIAPTDLTATPIHANQIRLDWTPVPNSSPQNGNSPLTAQVITLSPAPTSGSATVELPITATSYTYTTNQRSGSNFIDYTATIRARNAVGDGPTTSVTGRAGGRPTAAVTELSSEPFNANGTIRLNWTPVPDVAASNGGKSIVGYHVTWQPTSGPESSPYFLSGQQPGTALGGYAVGQTYTFRVYANNEGDGITAGDGPAATLVVTIPGPPTAPAASTANLTVPADSSVYARLYLTFSAWTAPPGGPPVTKYEAACTPTAGGATITSEVTPGIQNTLLLTANTEYRCDLIGSNYFAYTDTWANAAIVGLGPRLTR